MARRATTHDPTSGRPIRPAASTGAALLAALVVTAACTQQTSPAPHVATLTAEESAVVARARTYLLEARPNEPLPELPSVSRASGEWYVRFAPPPPTPGAFILGGGWAMVVMAEDDLALVDIVYGQ